MVTFFLPRSQTLEIAECPKRLAMVRSLRFLEESMLRGLIGGCRKGALED